MQNFDQIDDHFWLLWPLVESNLESYMIFNFSVDVGTEISKFDTQNQQRLRSELWLIIFGDTHVFLTLRRRREKENN